MKKHTRILALFLALALCIQMLPASSFAEESEGAANPELNTIETGNVKEAFEGRPGTVVHGELTEKRTETGKHFRMNDGSFIAVDYGAVVHYTTDGGETWEDIDNTLLLPEGDRGNASEDSDDAEEINEDLYLAENGTASRGFAQNLSSGLLFSATNGNCGLRMGLVGGSEGRGDALADDKGTAASSYNTSAVAEISYPDVKTRGGEDLSLAEQVIPSKLRADVLYRNVYRGVDLSYELYSYDIKETILINQPQDNYSFSFSLNLEALMPELLEDGSIELRDADGETIYLIPAPYMTDTTGDCSNAVSYSLEKTDSGDWKLTVKADETWINSEDRSFPVSIDPTVIDRLPGQPKVSVPPMLFPGHQAQPIRITRACGLVILPITASMSTKSMWAGIRFPLFLPAARLLTQACIWASWTIKRFRRPSLARFMRSAAAGQAVIQATIIGSAVFHGTPSPPLPPPSWTTQP